MPADSAPISTLLDAILDDPAITPLLDLLQEGGACSARGGTGSSGVHLVAALAKRLGRPLVLVPAHLDDADEAVDECLALLDFSTQGMVTWSVVITNRSPPLGTKTYFAKPIFFAWC